MTLVLVRDLPHPPAKVWRALTEPEHLREWAPFDAVGPDALKFGGWQRMHAEYAHQFGVPMPGGKS